MTSMEQHIRILGILNIVSGVLGLLVAMLFLMFFGGIAFLAGMDNSPDAGGGAVVLSLIGAVAFIIIAVISLPAIIAGYGLLHHLWWSHTLAIVLSALHLMNFPLGTALGIYGLWVLLQEESKSFFAARATA